MNPNTVIGILQGKPGDLVFVSAKDGSVIVKYRPVRTTSLSAAQLANHKRFAQAAAVALCG